MLAAWTRTLLRTQSASRDSRIRLWSKKLKRVFPREGGSAVGLETGGEKMNGEDANNPRRGIVGGMPDGFSASTDDGSKLLALLQGGQEPGRQAPGLAPQQPAFMGTMMPVPPPPGSQPQSQGHLLPPGMTLGLNARSTQPPGLPDPRASSGFLSGLQPQQQQRGVAASSDGWNPTQFVQDVGSSLLFGGNSTWSMSDQESSQGLGSLWSRPAQGGGGGGGRPLEPSSMAPPPPPPRLGSAGPIGPGGLPPTLLSRPSAAEGFQVRHGHAAAGGDPPGHHHLQQARAGAGAPRPPPQMDGERRQQPHQRLEDRRERGRGRGQEGYNRIRGSMGYTKQPKWQPQALNRELMRMYQSLLPTKQEVQMKNKCFKKIQRILNKKFRGSALHMFGSSANNLGVCQNHDIDLSIEIDVRPDASDDSGSDSENEDLRDQISGRNNNSNGGGGGGGDPRPTQQQVVKQMAGLLRRSRMSKVFAIPKARVPIVKFIEPETSIECDICVNNLLAVENTSLLRLYSEIDPRLKELVILIKHWSKCRGVNGAFKGTLSSYAYVIMVIHLLQVRLRGKLAGIGENYLGIGTERLTLTFFLSLLVFADRAACHFALPAGRLLVQAHRGQGGGRVGVPLLRRGLQVRGFRQPQQDDHSGASVSVLLLLGLPPQLQVQCCFHARWGLALQGGERLDHQKAGEAPENTQDPRCFVFQTNSKSKRK